MSHFRGLGSQTEKPLKFAARQAIDENREGLVAVTDADDRPKFKDLKAARGEFRSKGHCIPFSIGEAEPHFDVWLLDDKKAVASFCEASDDKIADSTKCYPKDELDRLLAMTREPRMPIADELEAIAHAWEYARCIHRRDNGLESFVDDLIDQFKER